MKRIKVIILVSLLQLNILSILLLFLSYFYPTMGLNSLLLYLYALAIPYIYYVLHTSIAQKKLFQEAAGMFPLPVKNAKYHRSRLDEAEALQIIGHLKNTISSEKLFLDPELTLQQIVVRLKVPSYKISQSLSQSANQSFYELVNGYRIDRAKELLLDPNKRHFTILAIAFEAGFNSKSTFNNAFKKATGLTPSQFLKRTEAA